MTKLVRTSKTGIPYRSVDFSKSFYAILFTIMKLIYRAKFQLIWINIVILTEICVYGNFSLPLAKVLAKDFFFLIFFCKIEFGKSRQFSGLP